MSAPALFVMRAQPPAPCAIDGMASLTLVLEGRTGKVFNLAGCAEDAGAMDREGMTFVAPRTIVFHATDRAAGTTGTYGGHLLMLFAASIHHVAAGWVGRKRQGLRYDATELSRLPRAR
jgi:hypothetical protein